MLLQLALRQSSRACGRCSGAALPRAYTSASALHWPRSASPEFTTDRIRNFSVIAHIDHGKSTLADRLLEMTGTISKRSSNKQVLDKLEVERERGITVKAQTASMIYEHKGTRYLLNLIDTPGHVDFSYEVSRSLSACQGTLLLVDACQGIQAQTVANFFLAFSQDLTIIPVINKVASLYVVCAIDMVAADPERIARQMESAFDVDASEALKVSAKTGINVDQILPAVIERIPSPVGDREKPLRALLFDSWYDQYVGVVCLVAIKDGQLRKGDRIVSSHTENKYEAMEVGLMYPEQVPTGALYAGQVGYVVCSMKNAKEAHIGDTFYRLKHPVEPLPGFEPAKSMVFAGIYPVDADDFAQLEESIVKLTLNDASVNVQKETSLALGQGWRLGFLGTLHLDVFRQRLEQEYAASVIVTQPTVPFKVVMKDGKEVLIRTPADFPSPEHIPHHVSELQEPMVLATLIFPSEYLGPMMELCGTRRGEQQEYQYLDDHRVMIKYKLPLAEIVTDFYDELKSRSSGFASFDYEEIGYQESDLVKMDVLLNGKPVDALATVLHRSQIQVVGRDWAKRLKGVIQRQLFEVAIQTAVGSRVIARETVPAMRKNVTAKCYGGDVTRKMKLLNKQREGKKRMKRLGSVDLPQEAFLTLMNKGGSTGGR
ncbi:P-loop containing nucleoside triphosphate hydrolase protein [Thamnocephalis sphaerospora]|uniref:P-loop containing nucleoside triphosphate hydrolase protein n=1 Tax=Thamnocephalis sphaerospora TaxID=78915 RepID=A0A4P9XUT4_9FUNG|nr:P-loop containing nucleoside triphosphate hydrolase protein [Thamnocephalis sphaerospora]|eukprot:RKP09995.1 P-loop containing nucleoside triphosphate hydrolase protein [Thamnocephalis sphaerospora]